MLLRPNGRKSALVSYVALQCQNAGTFGSLGVTAKVVIDEAFAEGKPEPPTRLTW